MRMLYDHRPMKSNGCIFNANNGVITRYNAFIQEKNAKTELKPENRF